MASQDLLPGNRFRALRSAGGMPETFTFVCIAQSKTLTLTNEYEDATVPDCDQPLSIPARKSTLRSSSWGGRLAGMADAKRFADLRADAASQTPVRYQFLIDRTAVQGGGAWTGAIFIENLEIASENNGMVRFTVQFRGDDQLVWAAVA